MPGGPYRAVRPDLDVLPPPGWLLSLVLLGGAGLTTDSVDAQAEAASTVAAPSPQTEITAAAAAPRDSGASESMRRSELVAAFLANSPEFRLADARIAIAHERSEAARSLPAPELMIEGWNIPFRRPYALDEATMWMAIVRQSFEPRGLRDRRRESALGQAEIEAARRLEANLDVADEAAAVHAEIATREAVVRARVATLEAMRRVHEATVRRLAGGSVTVIEIADIEAEIALAEVELERERAGLSSLVRATNARIGRDADAPLTVYVDAEDIDTTTLHARLSAHPALRAASARTRTMRAQLEGAEIEARRPRFTAGAGVFGERGPHAGAAPRIGYGVVFGLDLPWIGGRAAGEREIARAELALSIAEEDATSFTLVVALERALAESEAAQRTVASFDAHVLPALEHLAETTTSQLASGGATVRDLLEVRARLERARIERAMAVGERLRSEAALFALDAVLTNREETDR